MSTKSWIRNIFTRPVAATIRKSRLGMLTLEDRTVPTVFTPTIFTDGGAGSGSLRAAIISTNLNVTANSDTISLNSGTYTLTISNASSKQENGALTGDLDITQKSHTVIIQGKGTTGAGATIIDASALMDRVFHIVNPGTVVQFNNLVIRGGLARDNGTTGAVADTTVAYGGGIFSNGGTITLNNVVLQSNTVRGGLALNASGGGLYSSGGSLTLTNSTLSANTADGGEISYATFPSPHGDGLGGGLAALNATTTITNSTFESNIAFGGSSPGTTGGTTTYHGGGEGGGLYSNGGSATIKMSTFSSNVAKSGVGGGRTGFNATDFGTDPFGSYIADLLQGNGTGGGVFVRGSTTLIQASTFANNQAVSTSTSGNPVARGGAVFSSGGVTTIEASTLANNSAVNNHTGNGGSVILSTSDGLGGNLAVGPTITYAPSSGKIDNSGSAKLSSNIILSGNGGNLTLQGNATWTGSSNVIPVGGSGLTGTIVADPMLSPLGNYGGPTQTLALLPGSPALSGGLAVSGLTTDQRGVARTSPIDIGAFQSRGFTVTVSGGNSQSAFLNTAFATPLKVTVSSAFAEPVVGGKVNFVNSPSTVIAAANFNNSTVTIAADASATAPGLPSANSITGTYKSLTATTTRSNTAVFTLTNLPSPTVVTISSMSDSLAPGSLRSAIIAMNADPGTATKIIELQAGTFSLSLPGNDDSANSGDLDITSTAHSLIIRGKGTTGANATIIDASLLNDRVFHIVNPGTIVQFENLVIKGGKITGTGPGGGGIFNNGGNVTISNVVFDSNSAIGNQGKATISGSVPITGFPGFNGQGGALFASAGSVMSISDTTFSSNSTKGGESGFVFDTGNALVTAGQGGAGQGGAVFADGATITFINSTFSANGVTGGASRALNFLDAPVNGGAGGDAHGGAIFARNGALTIINSTFSANSAQAGNASNGYGYFQTATSGGNGGNGLGGAVASENQSLIITNSTLFNNTTLAGTKGLGDGTAYSLNGNIVIVPPGPDGAAGNAQGGGVSIIGSGTINNTIVAGSIGGDIAQSGGTLSGGFNLIQDGSGGLANTIKANPLLGPLTNNGGPTATFALLPGSPAINAGSNALIPAGVTTDARGLPRTYNTTIDIGAVEIVGFTALSSTTIAYGTATTKLTGHIGTGTTIPVGASIGITLNAVSQNATVESSGNFTTTFNTATLAANKYVVTYAFAGIAGFPAATDTSTTLTVNPLPPTTVTLVTVNAGNTQRSRITQVTVNFSAPVDAATLTTLGAIKFTRTTATTTGIVGTVVQTGASGVNGRIQVAPMNGMVASVTLTFDNASGSASSAGVESGSLADGRWQLAIPLLSYQSNLNDPSLYRLFGDADGNHTVDAADFSLFGSVFGSSAAGSRFDADGNGTIDSSDFAQFGSRFGVTL